MAKNLDTNTQNGRKWHRVSLDSDLIAERITSTDTGPKVLGIRPLRKPTPEEVRASFMEKGCYDVILTPGDGNKINVRFRYHPRGNGINSPNYSIH